MRIYFSPDCPTQQDYSIVAMIHYLGYSVARSADEPFDLGYLWQDSTHVQVPQELLDIAKAKLVINLNCIDISKRKVDQIWAEVTGVHSLVNPRQYRGKVIQKFDANGQGGGEVIHCPVADHVTVTDTHVYQQYLDTHPAGTQLEYRVPVVMERIPIVYEVLKDDPELVAERKIKNQFKRSITPKSSRDVFSQSEQTHMIEFCRRIGLDVGELDVLRCRATKQVYIIDVNTTPTYFNMFNRYWRPEEKRHAIAAVAECWEARLAARLSSS